EFLKLSVGTVAVAALSREVNAQDAVKEIRIGYQKNGVLVIARQQAALEKKFAPQGIAVKWVEFSSGPPMLEAMNVGSVAYGAVGCGPSVRQWQHRRLVDLGSVFRDRRDQTERPYPGQRVGNYQDQLVLHRQPRLCEESRSGAAADH